MPKAEGKIGKVAYLTKFRRKQLVNFTKKELTKKDSFRIMVYAARRNVRVELTRSEMEIMDVLWCDGGALSRADFLERSEEKTWKDSSVHILLNGLLNKGAIREAGFVRHNKTYGRTFLPTMSREEYFAATIFSHRCKPDILGLVKALLDRPEVTKQTLTALEAQIKAKKETL